MINKIFSHKQQIKVVFVVCILPCMSMACGLAAQQKIITHPVDSDFGPQQENYSTIVCDFFSKLSNKKFKLASIDGKKIQITPDATDHYRLKPGRHTAGVEEVDLSYPRLYKKDITFEAVAGAKYVLAKEDICVAKEEGRCKIFNFFYYYKVTIKEENTNKIVSYPFYDEFQPIIGEGTRSGLFIPSMLHLYKGTELQNDKIAKLNLDAGGLQSARTQFQFKKISGTTIDGSKIVYENQGFFYPNSYFQLALLPGIYSVEFPSGNLFLHALAGNSYQLKYKEVGTSFLDSTRKFEVFIENVTVQAK